MIAYWIICSCFSWWITGSENMVDKGVGPPFLIRVLLAFMGPWCVFMLIPVLIYYEDQK